MDEATITRLMTGLTGEVIGPGSASYDGARAVWNGTIDKRPRLIVRPRTSADVVEAVRFGHSEALPVAVRGGGHHVAGGALIDDGVVIHLSEMRAVELDIGSRTVTAQGGALLADVDNATLPHELAVPTGLFSETGIGGLTLAGGYGWLRRKHGLTCDSLIAAELVTSEGAVITAGADHNQDLLWALRGGGWDLGVVTSFVYRAHPVPADVFFLFVAYPVSEAGKVFASLDSYVKTAPREASPLAVIWTFPASDPYPQAVWNRPFVAIIGPYMGPADEGAAAYQPLRQVVEPPLDLSDVMPFANVQHAFDEEYPKGRRYYWKSTYLEELTPSAVNTLLDFGNRRPSPLTSLDLWPLGGAVSDVTDSAVAHREAEYLVGIESNWEGPAADALNIAWARDTQRALEPFSTGGSYLNFDDPGEVGRVAASRGPHFDRLAAIKRKYDPGNLFRSGGGLVDRQ